MEETMTRIETGRPTVWGLAADDLHDAYWRAHGVQCIRRGAGTKFQPGADLYLLIDADQLVSFDVISLADRLAWRAARITRLRVVDHYDEPYGERVCFDEDGFVKGITRHYRPRRQSAHRVILTRKRRFARMWMLTENRWEGWRRISRAAGIAHIDNWRCDGGCYTSGLSRDDRRLIDRLVATWPRPDRVIDGIHQDRDGVWIRHGDVLDAETTAIGPAWLGRSTAPESRQCVVGPAWHADEPAASPDLELAPLKLRDIRDVDPGETPPTEAPSAKESLGYAIAKRTFDVSVSLLSLLFASPVFVVLALCILLSDGRPIFYGGLRQSRGGRSFRCWKFRTMYKNADEIKHTLSGQNAADGPQFFMENDPRVLRIGHFLRRYHLDELPQLWNVLFGQMSMVGPRPSPDEENQKCPAWREIRLSVKPGITGLWQLRRTREPGLDFQEWIRYDIEYVEKAGFWFDLKIFLATFFVVLGKGLHDASDETG